MEKLLPYKNAKIFFRIEGKGRPVVLIHGFGEDGTIWNEQVSFLKKDFRIIIPDIPGSGGSSVISYESTIDQYAECIKAVLEFEQITTCSMIGHSMGGYITLAFGEKYPGYLKSLGLFHSTAYPDNEEKKSARRKSIEIIRQYGAYPFLQQSIPNLFSENFKKQNQEIVNGLIERYKSFDPKSLISYYEAMIRRPGRISVLEKFQGAILFIIGEQDKAVPIEQSLKQSHIPSLSYVHLLQDAAHMGMLENISKSNFFLKNFLDETA